MKPQLLNKNEFSPFYGRYIDKTYDIELTQGLEDSKIDTQNFLDSIEEGKYNFTYELGKWTIKEVVQHIIDTERIFACRALRFSRNDLTPLPGFEQDDYVQPSDANRRSKDELIYEYLTVRNSTQSLFNSFTDDMLLRIGSASNSPMSVRAIGFIIIGHEKHHIDVIKTRYL